MPDQLKYCREANTVSKTASDRYFAALDAMRRYRPKTCYADPGPYFRAAEACLAALPEAITYWRRQYRENPIPPSIPCRDELPDMYMRYGRWDDALRVLQALHEMELLEPNAFSDAVAWLEKCRSATEAALAYISEHPGCKQNRLYSLVSGVDREALKWFTRFSRLIYKVKDGNTNALYALRPSNELPRLDSATCDLSRCSLALCMDVETTGLDPARDKIIEIAAVLFAFESDTGSIVGIVEEYVGQEDPGREVPFDVYLVNGLQRDKLKGKMIDWNKVRELAERAEFYVAHNAKFDYDFVGSKLPRKKWLCSMEHIDWKRLGYSKRGLQYLLEAHEICTRDAHRAGGDAYAVLALLSIVSSDGRTYLKWLLDATHAVSPSPMTQTSESKKAGSCLGCLLPVAAMLAILGWLVLR